MLLSELRKRLDEGHRGTLNHADEMRAYGDSDAASNAYHRARQINGKIVALDAYIHAFGDREATEDEDGTAAERRERSEALERHRLAIAKKLEIVRGHLYDISGYLEGNGLDFSWVDSLGSKSILPCLDDLTGAIEPYGVSVWFVADDD